MPYFGYRSYLVLHRPWHFIVKSSSSQGPVDLRALLSGDADSLTGDLGPSQVSSAS